MTRESDDDLSGDAPDGGSDPDAGSETDPADIDFEDEEWDDFGADVSDIGAVDIDDDPDIGRDRTGDPLDREPPDDPERRLSTPERTLDSIAGYREIRARFDRYVVGRYRAGGVEPVPNPLLIGPDGVGKRRFIDAIAGEIGAGVVRVGAPEGPGETPFGQPYRAGDRLAVAEKAARSHLEPCLLHVAALDALGGPDSPVPVDELVDRFLALVDAGVLVLGTASGAVPEALAEWFELSLDLPAPGPDDRRTILRALLRDRPTDLADGDWRAVADATDGFLRSDLEWVAREASYAALDEGRERGEVVPIRGSHLLTAATAWGDAPDGTGQDDAEGSAGSNEEPTGPFGDPFSVLPAVHRPEGSLSRVADGRVAERLTDEVVDPLARADRYEEFDVRTRTDLLLCGSSAARRADIVRALAGELGHSVVTDDARRWVTADHDEALERLCTLFDTAAREEPCLGVVTGLDRALDGRFARSERGIVPGQVSNELCQQLTDLHGSDIVLVGLAGVAGPVDDALLRRLGCRVGIGPGPDRRMSVLRRRLERHPVEVGDIDRSWTGMANGLAGVDIDPDWCRTMMNGLSVAEIRRIADLAARRASRDGPAVTNADIEDALRRHLTVAVG